MQTLEIIRLVIRIAHLIDVPTLRKLVADIEARNAAEIVADLLTLAEKAVGVTPATAAAPQAA